MCHVMCTPIIVSTTHRHAHVVIATCFTICAPSIQVCRQAEGLDTGQFKLVVADAAVSFLEPIQERMREHLADRARLWHILEEGSRRARQIAIRTMNEVHRASGMAPLRITDSAKSLAQTSSY